MAAKTNIKLRQWTEQIDQRCHAHVAEFEEVWKGRIYGAAAIVLFDPTDWRARSAARSGVVDKLKREITEGVHLRHSSGMNLYGLQHNRMPCIGEVRDLKR